MVKPKHGRLFLVKRGDRSEVGAPSRFFRIPLFRNTYLPSPPSRKLFPTVVLAATGTVRVQRTAVRCIIKRCCGYGTGTVRIKYRYSIPVRRWCSIVSYYYYYLLLWAAACGMAAYYITRISYNSRHEARGVTKVPVLCNLQQSVGLYSTRPH